MHKVLEDIHHVLLILGIILTQPLKPLEEFLNFEFLEAFLLCVNGNASPPNKMGIG